ncbi:MAG: hypothetical protein ACK4M3_02395 [Pyrobaculum sp.]
MAKEYVKQLRYIIDLLESAVEEGDCKAVEEAIDELKNIVEELE